MHGLGGTHPASYQQSGCQLWVLVDAFYRVQEAPSVPSFLRVFITRGCWISSNAFSMSIEMTASFYSLFHRYSALQMLNQPCVSRIEPAGRGVQSLFFATGFGLLVLRDVCVHIYNWY